MITDTDENPFNRPASEKTPLPLLAPLRPNVEGKERLGSGVITRLLGHGGMAYVYEIWVENLEIFRAVKVMKPDASAAARERFKTEMRVMAKLSHENIVAVNAVGEWNGLPFIEMEKIDGGALDELLRRFGALPPAVVTALGVLICRALSFAHSQHYTMYGSDYTGIVHRDLKPGNIMITKSGQVKLMDFGIARPVEASFHTVDGAMVGTIQYMAPELLEGGKVDPKIDIYSLGATLYELLTGKNPFPEKNFAKLIALKQANSYTQLSRYPIKIPKVLQKLVQGSLNENPAKRPQTVKEIGLKLERLHHTLTKESPEEVVARFTQESPGVKQEYRAEWRLPWEKLVVVFGGLMVVIALTAGLYPVIQEVVATYNKGLHPQKVIITKTVTLPARSTVTTPKNATPVEEIDSSVVDSTTPLAADSPALGEKPVAIEKPKEDPFAFLSALVPSQRDPADDLLKRMSERYGVTDPGVILEKLIVGGDNQTARRFFTLCFDRFSDKKRASLLMLELIERTGSHDELRAFLGAQTIHDGAYYRVAAQQAFDDGRYADAGVMAQRALATPALLVNYPILAREASLVRARSASRQFDKAMTTANYRKALESWRKVGELSSSEKEGSPFKEYLAETKRLGEQHRRMQIWR